MGLGTAHLMRVNDIQVNQSDTILSCKLKVNTAQVGNTGLLGPKFWRQEDLSDDVIRKTQLPNYNGTHHINTISTQTGVKMLRKSSSTNQESAELIKCQLRSTRLCVAQSLICKSMMLRKWLFCHIVSTLPSLPHASICHCSPQHSACFSLPSSLTSKEAPFFHLMGH